MKIKRLIAAAAMAAAPVLTWAADASAQLERFVTEVQSATGRFTQTQQGGSKQGGQVGEFSFQRPGKFKWEVIKPYEQLIISDGEKVYQYDPDLEQVTVRSVDESIGASPAAILFGSGRLGDAFELASLPSKDGMDWLRATPRSPDAGFTHVDIGFRADMPAQLDLLDSFGQTTRIELSDIKSNATLPSDEFRFEAPVGVDVVNMQ